MKNYIAFIAGLPDIMLDDRNISLDMKSFMEASYDYLDKKDRKRLRELMWSEDNRLLLQLLRGETVDENLSSAFTPLELQRAVDGNYTWFLPPYMYEFINDYKKDSFKYPGTPEAVLDRMYLETLLNSKYRFVSRYANFILDMKNLISALNCRKYGRDITAGTIGDNDFVKELRTSQLKDFGLAAEYDWVEKVVSLMSNKDLLARERGLSELEWDFIDKELTYEYFSFDVLMGYMLKLKILDRWSKLDYDSGRKVFMDLVDRFRSDLEFGEQFEK